MKTKLILALDVDDIELARKYVRELSSNVDYFKVGSQFFTIYGPQGVKMITESGGKVFLDLKYHDIPNTVEKSARASVKLGVSIFNVHATGGADMLKSAVHGAMDESSKLGISSPVVLGVTILTSISERMYSELFGEVSTLKEKVLSLCSQCSKYGLDGVVASPEEIEIIKNKMGEEFKVLTPGIRPEWSDKNEQKRVATPKKAVDLGADYIVIGRPILNASDPVLAVERIRREMDKISLEA